MSHEKENKLKKFESIIEASNTFIKTIKKLIGLTKTSYEEKLAKAKAWHEFKQMTNPEYINHLITILIALVKIFILWRGSRVASGMFLDSRDGRF
jgi:hypothetical protein